MNFRYYDNNNIEQTFKLTIGQKWNEIIVNNDILNSVFSKIDDGDGYVSNNEFLLFQQLFTKVQSFFSRNDGVIDNEEIGELNKEFSTNYLKDIDKLNITISNFKAEDFSLDKLKERFPADRYTIEMYSEYWVIHDKNDEGRAIFEISFNDNKIEYIYDYTINNSKNEYLVYYFNEEGDIDEYRDNDWNFTYPKEYVKAKDLWTKIQTNKSLEESLKEITPENIKRIISSYSQFNNDLIEDLIENYSSENFHYLEFTNFIINNLIEHYRNQGIQVDDIEKEMKKELYFQMYKINLANSNFLEAYIEKLDSRTTGNQNNITPNGKIDENFEQGYTGDCWLLAAIIAINNNPKGKEILNNSIKINEDESITVHLKGVDKKYTISKEELENNTQLATGDLDTRALEIAFDKYFQDMRGVNDSPDINGNQVFIAYEILLGKSIDPNSIGNSGNFRYNKEVEITDDKIDNFNDSNLIIAVSSNADQDQYIYKSEREHKITLYTSHAYAVKGSDENFVYLINPHDTGNVISVPREDFKNFFNKIHEISL